MTNTIVEDFSNNISDLTHAAILASDGDVDTILEIASTLVSITAKSMCVATNGDKKIMEIMIDACRNYMISTADDYNRLAEEYKNT